MVKKIVEEQGRLKKARQSFVDAAHEGVIALHWPLALHVLVFKVAHAVGHLCNAELWFLFTFHLPAATGDCSSYSDRHTMQG